MSEMMFEGKVAIVTGSARGIGFAIGQELAKAGARVALVDLKADLAEQAATQLRSAGYEATAVAADVSDEAQVRAMAQQALNRWGQVDILVNNAGICPVTPFEEITVEEWDLVLGVNLKGAFLCSKAVAPIMRKQHSGKIINIASSAGQMGGLAVGLHYSASKAGMFGLTKGLARILAPDIQVNAVSPGTTESEMTSGWDQAATDSIVSKIPAGRLGRPVDVAAAVLFLASDVTEFITGQTLSVNGGLLMV
jgi:NAD(P)-dependent dehydrogenase (short-subunit alcohol dehydrogenase family)